MATAQITSMSAFSGVLTGATIVPASGSVGGGSLRVDLFWQGVMGVIMGVSLKYRGLSSGCTAIHVHGPAAAGANGPIVWTISCSPNVAGAKAAVFLLSPTQQADLRNGLYYLDVVDAAFPNGELRAQIAPTRGFVGRFTSAGVVPSPSTSTAVGSAIVTVAPDNTAYVAFFLNGLGLFNGQLHLHGGAAPGVTGPQIAQFLSAGGTSVSFATAPLSTILTPSQIDLLKAGLLYLDIHTAAFPDGELRAQLHQPGTLTDFDGEGRADISVFRPSTGLWYAQNPGSTAYSATPWGLSGDAPVPGDYDGDGASDNAVFRNGIFFVRHSLDGNFDVVPFGLGTDETRIPGDYDGDGHTDVAVMRRGAAGTPITFYSLNSLNGVLRATFWGTSDTDVSVVGDYDGDGKSDVAIYRVPTNTYYVLNSSTGTMTVFPFATFATDFLAPADYDGDGKTDFAVFRFAGANNPGTWFIWQSSTNSLRAEQLGAAGDVPVPGDYDGDGKSDLSVYRTIAGNLVWFTRRSSDGGMIVSTFGITGDFATPVVVVR